MLLKINSIRCKNRNNSSSRLLHSSEANLISYCAQSLRSVGFGKGSEENTRSQVVVKETVYTKIVSVLASKILYFFSPLLAILCERRYRWNFVKTLVENCLRES